MLPVQETKDPDSSNTFTFPFPASTRNSKSSETWITQTHLANDELCVLNSQGHTRVNNQSVPPALQIGIKVKQVSHPCLLFPESMTASGHD